MIISYHIICQISTALCKNSKKHFFASIFNFPPFCLLYSNRFAVAAPLPPSGILYILPSFLKISCAVTPKNAANTADIETAHILRLFYLCCLCQCGQQSASRMDFSVYRPILQAGNFCAILHFLCPLSPARLQGRSLCEHTANSGAKVWYTARFCAILDKKSIQPGRARHKRGNT